MTSTAAAQIIQDAKDDVKAVADAMSTPVAETTTVDAPDTRVTVYTNDVALESARQASLPEGTDRLPKMRNRIARGKTAGRLLAIAMVATDRGDKTIATEARAKAAELGFIEKGQPLKDVVKIVDSRRPSRSKSAIAVGLATDPIDDAVARVHMETAASTDEPALAAAFASLAQD